ncbi:SMC-Scp complex subunit ScpB, partial [Candidatus Wolfebacteria bacterium]|nr:SMC-Scp complex subunit ScpB [Candidatus Wolfebacteria bacterium]
MEEDKKNITAEIEAFLFVYGEPLEVKKISKMLSRPLSGGQAKGEKVSEAEVKEAVSELQKKYSEGGGLNLIFSDSPAGQKVQLATKSEFAPLMEEFIKDEFKEDLTPASLETLSLIAYLGPISRAQIDYYRGVNSSFILRNLLMRGLVERYTDPQRANVYFYQA